MSNEVLFQIIVYKGWFTRKVFFKYINKPKSPRKDIFLANKKGDLKFFIGIIRHI